MPTLHLSSDQLQLRLFNDHHRRHRHPLAHRHSGGAGRLPPVLPQALASGQGEAALPEGAKQGTGGPPDGQGEWAANPGPG